MNFKKLLKLSICVAAVCAVTIVYYYSELKTLNFKPRCPLYLYTGFFCPGCGSMRAASAIVHGNFLQAIHYNVMLIAIAPLAVGFILINLFYSKRKAFLTTELFSRFFIKTVIMAFVSFGILRNIPVFPFTLLAPTGF